MFFIPRGGGGHMMSQIQKYIWEDPIEFSRAMLSISRNARLYVRLSVHLFTFEVSFKRLFAPTSQSRMSKIFLEIRNRWGKVMVRNGLRLEHFCFVSGLKSQKKKNSFFWLILPTKQGGNHASRWIRDL